jgi:foldase protein PrsA
MLKRLLLALALGVALPAAGCRSTESHQPEAASSTQPAPTVQPATETSLPAAVETAASPEAVAPAPAVEDMVASVNGTPIPLEDFRRQAMDTQGYFVEQGLDPNSTEGQKRLLAIRRQVLDDMINQSLVEQAAPELGVAVTDDDVQASLDDHIAAAGGQAAFEKSMQEAGTTLDQVRAMERASLIGQRVFEEVVGDIPTAGEFLHARHILCNTREECAAALERLEAGEAFDEVARDVSADETTRDTGGDLDWVGRGTLPSAQVEQAIFALQPGQRSGIVQTEYGYHIFEVIERDPNHTLSEEQRLSIKESRVLEWLAQRRAQSAVEIYVDELKPGTSG